MLGKHPDHKQQNTSRSLISIIDQYFSPVLATSSSAGFLIGISPVYG